MGLFSSNDKYLNVVNEIKKEAKVTQDSNVWMFSERIKSDCSGKTKMVIQPKSTYYEVIARIYYNNNIESKDYIKVLNYANEVYSALLPNREATPNYDMLLSIYLDMLNDNGAIARQCFDMVTFNLFDDKVNYLRWVKGVAYDVRYIYVIHLCRKYGLEARCYFPSEEMFTANFMYVSGLIVSADNPDEVYARETQKVEHMAGIYEVDEARLMEAEQQILAAKEIVSKSKEMLSVIEERTRTIEALTEHAVERVKQISSTEVELAQARIDSIDVKLKDAYDKFLDTQRERILFDKKQLVDEVVAESEGKLAEFKQNVRNILNMAKLELSKLNQESGSVMDRLSSALKDDDKLKELLKQSNEQKKLMAKLERLMILNDNNIDFIENQIEQQKQAAADNTEKNAKQESAQGAKNNTPGAQSKVVYTAVSNASSQSNTAATVVYNAEDYDPNEIPSVNPLLDEEIEFKQRYDIVMKAKKEMEKNGEHFHKMFDDVLIAVMENVNPYLIGPSGCGKTYMVSQICRLLNSSFIDIGYINEEYDILGFQTANGGYSRPNFYRCYKYGKIAFCDELDNGNSRATVKLNSFLANTKDAGYSFPNGEFVKRHGSFRIIAAGNTSGNGADSVYNTREKIEESVQQRFTPIYVGYDNEVEHAILGDYEDWYEFIVLFRMATDEWSKKSHSAASGIITTRDTARIKKYLDNGSFNMEKIIDYEFIQTKDESYLAFIADQIVKNKNPKSPAESIVNCFVKKVDDIRDGLVIR